MITVHVLGSFTVTRCPSKEYIVGGLSEAHAILRRLIKSTRVANGLLCLRHISKALESTDGVSRDASESQTADKDPD